MSENIYAEISARMWSETISLRPIAALLGEGHIVHDKGDARFTARGTRLRHPSSENYLTTGDTKVTDLTAVSSEVARHTKLLENDPAISRLLDEGSLDAVVWVALFGDEGTVHLDDLHIDMTPFGQRFGLVVENYADLDATGNPRKLLIGRGTRRS